MADGSLLLGVFVLADFLEQPLVLKLILHRQVRCLKVSLLAHDLSNNSCVGFPLLLFALLPVVLPEVLVWLEHWHEIHLNCDINASDRHKDMVKEPSNILGALDA